MNDPVSARPEDDQSYRSLFGPAVHGSRRGVVTSYDPDAGLGAVEGPANAGESGVWMFHCTAIADGSRVIEPGTAVMFEVRAGGLGRFEAFNITPDGAASRPTW